VPHPAKRKSRATAIALVAALHGVIFTLLLRGGHDPLPVGEDEPAESTLVFFDSPTREPGPETSGARTAPNHVLSLRAIFSVAPTAPQSSSPDSTAPVAVDWAKEAEVAAGHQIEDGGAALRVRSALAPDRYRPERSPPAAPRFGWDYAASHRIEFNPGGGLLINVSDRCAIAIVFPVVLGGCRIGKVEARGDLFAHMHDQPTGEGASTADAFVATGAAP
jgi:hypothetical protein